MNTARLMKNPRTSGGDHLLEVMMYGLVGFAAGYATGKVLNFNPWATGAVGSFFGGVAGTSGFGPESFR